MAGIVIASLFTSCQEDFLDAPAQSTLESSTIFSDPTLAEGAVNGIKMAFGETNSYRGRYLPFYGFNTDVEWYNSSSQDQEDKSDLCTYNAQPTNGQMNTTNNVWAMMYAGIERANICIEGLRAYGDPKPGTDLGYLLGEALTLRAIYYADLVKTWGDVPARFEPISSATIYLEKSNRDIIYKQLLKDLGEAATLVPWPGESKATNSVERVNKAFVKGFRARLAMTASGYQQYKDGVHRSNDPELSVPAMYKLALDECRDVIASGKAHLEPSFETFWKNYNQEKLNAGGESLWEIPFSAGRGKMVISFGVLHNTVDQFQTGADKRGGTAGPLPYVFYDYDKADSRRDVSCVPYAWGKADANKIAKQELGTLNKWYFGKYRFEWMSRVVSSKDDDGLNKIYMRYAEVLLIAAEAANELEGPAAAAPYLKEIRNRAFAPADRALKVDTYVANVSGSKDAMFNAIVEESKYEFTGEMERKQSLIRWNLLKANLDAAKVKMQNLAARTGEYKDVPSKLYYKYKDDKITLDVYGLNKGEITPSADYQVNPAVDWTTLDATKINSLYNSGVNPDNKQYWPIWQVFIDASNGKLVNDLGY